MTPEHWRKAKEIFQAALETRAEELPAFLDQECAGDPALRDRVERMLAADAKENLAIDRPAVEGVAQLLWRENATSIIGMTLGHYRIESELGRGGMGQVYLAQDTRLNRPVAFKLLPEAFSRHPERVRRFQQEARAVSALNHPNIITIHEIGETEGLRFIITEYVDGQTVREIIASGERDLTRLLKIFIQVAEALAAAHNAGIIHRDIKPENIMLRRDGYVKVLDFGLAKPTEEAAIANNSDEQQPAQPVLSTPGVMLGTINYMSPEQARGHKVDARTDIFSLGVVLYEAVTGSRPFQGRTTADLLLAIAGQEPAPVTDSRPEVSGRLSQIISKALQKNQDERYQNIREMQLDLEELTEPLPVRPRDLAARGTDLTTASTTVSSAEYLVGGIKRHKIAAGIAALLAIFILTASVLTYRTLKVRQKTPSIDPAHLRFTRLTTLGNAWGTISPDGKYVLLSQNHALFIKQLVTGNTTEIMPPKPGYSNYGNFFSVDSNYVYAWLQERANPDNEFIERFSLVPGPSQRVLERVNSGFVFSPDGRRIAFTRGLNPRQQLFLADSDGSNEQVLARQPPEAVFRGVAWSPDGQLIAVSTSAEKEPGQTRWHLTAFRVADGAEIKFSAQGWNFIRTLVWLPDGSGLVLSANDRPDTNEQLLLVPYPTGNPLRLTPELFSFSGVSITADGSKLVTNQGDRPANIWVVPINAPSRATKVTQVAGPYGAVNWTPDGRIVYRTESGTRGGDISVINADGSNNRQIGFGVSHTDNLAVAPDGRYIVFSSAHGGGFNLWRMNQDGGDLRQLTTGMRDTMAVITPDNKSVIYESAVSDRKAIINRISIDGGTPTQIGATNLNYTLLAISPDGQRLAYERSDDTGQKIRTVIQSIADGTIQQELTDIGGRNLCWSPDGASLLYNEGSDVWRQALSGGSPQKLTNFATDFAISFSLSSDGKTLAVVQGTWTSDVVLIDLK